VKNRGDCLKHRGYIGSVEFSAEDRVLHGQVQFIDDLITYEGQSIDELDSSFRSAIDEYIRVCEKRGKQPNQPYKGSFNVRVGADMHRKAVQIAWERQQSLNEFVAKAIEREVEFSAGTIGLANANFVIKSLEASSAVITPISIENVARPQGENRVTLQ